MQCKLHLEQSGLGLGVTVLRSAWGCDLICIVTSCTIDMIESSACKLCRWKYGQHLSSISSIFRWSHCLFHMKNLASSTLLEKEPAQDLTHPPEVERTWKWTLPISRFRAGNSSSFASADWIKHPEGTSCECGWGHWTFETFCRHWKGYRKPCTGPLGCSAHTTNAKRYWCKCSCGCCCGRCHGIFVVVFDHELDYSIELHCESKRLLKESPHVTWNEYIKLI